MRPKLSRCRHARARFRLAALRQALLLLPGLALAASAANPAADTTRRNCLDEKLPLVFERITIDDGLPENSVRALAQDQSGFLWFGTMNGLVRFDGLEMEISSPDPGDSTSFGGRTVDALLEDRTGTLWIGTLLRGLWQRDRESGTFARFDLDATAAQGLAVSHVRDLYEDNEGHIWCATDQGIASIDPARQTTTWHAPFAASDNLQCLWVDDRGRVWCGSAARGLARYTPSTGEVRWYEPAADDSRSITSTAVFDILQGPDERLWFATQEGLCLWQESSGDFQRFATQRSEVHEANLFICLARDPSGLLWIGSAAGVYAFDPTTAAFRLFAHDQDNPHSPVNGPILSLLVDRSGLVWAGSWRAGLNKADPAGGRFRIRHFQVAGGVSREASIEAIHTARDGRLYLGASDLHRGRGRGQVFRRAHADADFVALPTNPADGPMPSVLSLQETPNGALWVGTWSGMWAVVDDVVVPADLGESAAADALRAVAVKAMATDASGRVWIASPAGLFRWDRERNELEHHFHDPADPRTISSNDVVAVYVDRGGRVWAGTDAQGLNLYRADGGFERFFDLQRGLDTVIDIYEADDGRLWLASFSGLIAFDPSTAALEIVDRRAGLPNDEVASIQPDDRGGLWLSTGNGFAFFDPQQRTARTYGTRDGLPNNEVKYAHARDAQGLLHFGGAGGLITFDPNRFVTSPFLPEVVLTDIALAGKPLAVSAESPLSALPHRAGRLQLRHDQNNLALSFAALDYRRPDLNRYRYRLEGLEGEWNETSAVHRADYNRLPPGDYTFRAMGTNRDGVWSASAIELPIRIRPPWWRTWWAYVLYAFASLALIYGLYQQLTQRERMRMRLETKRAEAKKLQELDELKTRFLTNITHEFRTPLTLIKVPLLRLQSEWKGEPDERIPIMLRNTDRLEQLINQLLDLSRLEAGRMPLRWQRGHCLTFLGIFASSFESLAAQRNIDIACDIAADPDETWYDADVLEKIVGNLLSNAIKFTPEEGKIIVTATMASEVTTSPREFVRTNGEDIPARELVVTVANSGSYLSPSERTLVFDRFHQVSRAGGSGVGLALVRELAGWLGGTVEVDSDPEHGTRFTATIPVYLQHPVGPVAEADHEQDEALDELSAEEAGDDEHRILIVEDNPDLLEFMAGDLADEFRILKAADGESGLEVAIAEIPDLVLSDVMMPGMDGFELCRRLKEDERTNHVPVILLTARSAAESRHEGLRLGADDYLSKPFDAEDLRLRIRNLIEQRRKLAELYRRKLAALSPEAVSVTSADERMIARLHKAIDDHLEDPDFKISDLCNEVGMSRSQLHRKLKAVTGKSTSDFVRTHRLQRAAQLIDGGYGNVTEVAYAVGFQSLSYFSRSFRELYDVQPSEYLRRRRDTDSEAPTPE